LAPPLAAIRRPVVRLGHDRHIGLAPELGARDRTHAVTIALQRGIIHLDE